MKRRSFFAGIAGVISAVVAGKEVKAEKSVAYSTKVIDPDGLTERFTVWDESFEVSRKQLEALKMLRETGGFTTVDGSFIKTGRIQSSNDYFELSTENAEGRIVWMATPVTSMTHEHALKVLQFVVNSSFEIQATTKLDNAFIIHGKSQFDECTIALTATSIKLNKSTRQGWTSFDVKSPKVVEFIQELGYAFS